MSYQAQTFNIMIASPNDVASERGIVRDAVYEWNAVNSGMRKIVLLPIAWESHSSPETGGTAQGIINEQILNKCDLLVGIFWTRIGTKTEDFSSGTVEEIETHILSGKPAMLYFSSAPVVPSKDILVQYERLEEFKVSMRDRSLYESYDSLTNFKDKFYRQLQLKVNEHSIFKSAVFPEQAAPSKLVESKTKLPTLSAEARALLKEASLDPQGSIMYIRSLGGSHLQTNGKNLIETGERREVAKWESALAELLQLGLLANRGTKGEMFAISDLGYQIADMIVL